ncbi:MAG: hybrid sensor histidine kinase/response regulator [Nodosilinea sp. WJT8-NPBG4]|jgi:chemosensory pili system protein ChpA (sensor histidine kinase/response regulator)|nr:hybrid sensor histidine kinase/response regulator [Nodosilinea sp. WJT8-NPBG4]
MDTEQQVRLSFLEEVEDYFEKIEAVALALSTAALDTAQLDQALRAAHSVKGGAAMMGFMPISQIAHRLEDFLKILRVRGDAIAIDAQIESLFLQGVDALRLASRCSRQGIALDDIRMKAEIEPIFEQLRSHLGDLRPEDDDLLLAQEENVDVATLIFSSGVEECLDEFEAQLAQLATHQLAAELGATTEQLTEFGRMSDLAVFVQLCESVQAYLPQISDEHIVAFGQEVLSTWRRSHALVLIGRASHLPHTIVVNDLWLSTSDPTPASAQDGVDYEVHDGDLALLGTLASGWKDGEADDLEFPGLDWLDGSNLHDLEDFVGSFGTTDSEPNLEPDLEAHPDSLEFDPDPIAIDLDLTAVADVQLDVVADKPAILIEALDSSVNVVTPTDDPALAAVIADLAPAPVRAPAEPMGAAQNTTVRVSAQQLQHLNALFGKLIVERNAVNLRHSQLHSLVALMQDRMGQIEQSSRQLRQWYDRASMEGLVSTSMPLESDPNPGAMGSTLGSLFPSGEQSSLTQQFDALEFDRYTDLHLISQEQMERIVQLQEVSSDIALSLREASTATTDLNYTTRALQSGMTKMQMRPFSTLVKRFPRVMRDLALQYNKQVNLTIEGDMTLIDQVAIEALTDPLNHLLRNAFGHGIELPEERIAAGKAAEGTITIRAIHRGNQTLITIKDDGRGIDPAKIRSCLRRMGMTEAEVYNLHDHDLLNMIFEPGFSTAEQVTELSGRGVGMDIVRTNVQQIRGDIRVDTRLGQGTTFTIQVPLAVSVLRVMLVESARLVFAIPIDSIKAMASLPTSLEERTRDLARDLVWEGQRVDLIRLEDWLQCNGAGRPFEMDGTPMINQPTVLVIQQDEGLQGLCIDRFWGEQEISLSPIKGPVALPAYFSSTGILGDGHVIPLLDPFQLLEWIQAQSPRDRELPPPSVPVALPRPPVQAVRSPASIAAVPAVSPGQSPTLLIVDDSINVRRYLALTLEKAGYQVEQAKDGQEAIDKLAAGLRVEAIICDIEMPRLDGYGVLSELRSWPDYQQLPIAMLTSRMNDKHRKLAMSLGASAYFSKPYNEQELLKTLQGLIEAAKEQAPRSREVSPALL